MPAADEISNGLPIADYPQADPVAAEPKQSMLATGEQSKGAK
jgi:hypothetical protein